MKKALSLLFVCICFVQLTSFTTYDGKFIEKITIDVQTKDSSVDTKKVLASLQTQEKTAFSQTVFDQDLKNLSENYDRVLPQVEMKENKLLITIKIWPNPSIQTITWKGNQKIKSKTLQKELGLKPGIVFIKEKFLEGIGKVKAYYVKKGYYNAQIDYSIDESKEDNTVNIHFAIKEGKSKKIKAIKFEGFTKEEKAQVSVMILSSKYNILHSWLTGKGLLQEELLEQDQMILLNYLHNQGYADAKIDVEVLENPKIDGLAIVFTAHRGTIYHVGDVTIDGNTIFSLEKLQKRLRIHKDDIFSPEKVQESAQSIQDLYGHKGYIETQVSYETVLSEKAPMYDVHFQIDERESFRIGLIRNNGNTQTKSNVILRESLLVPGENFDSRKLKATQQRLENIGYFKNVNVYAVRSNEDLGLGPNYRDVNIEIEEASTGSASLFVGLSSLEDVFAGIEFTERNFNVDGFTKLKSEGVAALRGGGEYAHLKTNIGKTQQSYLLSWMNPYFFDSLWRFGFETSYTQSKLISKNYNTHTYGGSLFTSYPITNFWTFTTKYRVRHEKTTVRDATKKVEEKVNKKNKGLLSAIGPNFSYDSTDRAYKPHKGIRSSFDLEFAGLGGKFKFLKMGYLLTAYHPLFCKKGTLKFLGDIKFIEPVLGKKPDDVPIAERFFLGGENTVRGYKPFILGPQLKGADNSKTPKGGISSLLLSLEYNYELLPILDVFAFIDAGSVSDKRFDIHKISAGTGVGIRLEIMKQMPISVGWAYPIKPERRSDTQRYFFSMGAQF